MRGGGALDLVPASVQGRGGVCGLYGDPRRSFFVDADDHLARYHSIFLQAQLEGMIVGYYEEVGTRHGDTS